MNEIVPLLLFSGRRALERSGDLATGEIEERSGATRRKRRTAVLLRLGNIAWHAWPAYFVERVWLPFRGENIMNLVHGRSGLSA